MTVPASKLSRRTLFAGAGAAGALVGVATLLPAALEGEPAPEAAKPMPARGGGYQLSEHVKQYYKTTQL